MYAIFLHAYSHGASVYRFFFFFSGGGRSDLSLSATFHWPFSRDGQLVAIISYANDLSLSFSLSFFYSVVLPRSIVLSKGHLWSRESAQKVILGKLAHKAQHETVSHLCDDHTRSLLTESLESECSRFALPTIDSLTFPLWY